MMFLNTALFDNELIIAWSKCNKVVSAEEPHVYLQPYYTDFMTCLRRVHDHCLALLAVFRLALCYFVLHRGYR